MRERITITDTALGSWYGPKKFELRTIELDFTDRSGATATTIRRYDMVWHKIMRGKRTTTTKRFESPEERTSWQKTSLANIEFEPLDPPVTVERGTPIAHLVGHRLAAVVFDDPTLELMMVPADKVSRAHRFSVTCNALVAVVTPDGFFTPDDFGYADSLVNLMGQEVVRADEFTDTGLTLEMSGGSAISITPHLARVIDTVATFPTPDGAAKWTPYSAVFAGLVGPN